MKAKGGSKKAAFIGCCDLGFEKEAYMAYEMGLKAVDPAFSMTYIPSGGFPYDFDNTAGATEAFNNAVAQALARSTHTWVALMSQSSNLPTKKASLSTRLVLQKCVSAPT